MNLRKLDALIGEHIFGFKIVDYKAVGRLDKHIETKDGGLILLPQYSKHIGAAWDVVKRFGRFDLSLGGDGKWCAIFTGSWDRSFAETAPLAICLSALKSKGIDISEWDQPALT